MNCIRENTRCEGLLPHYFSVYLMLSLSEAWLTPMSMAFLLPVHVVLVFPELSLFQLETQPRL